MVVCVFAVVTIRTTVDPWIPLFSGYWDALFALIVYLGQRRTFVEGGILTLFAGHIYSLSSSAPIGLFVIYYGVIFLVARLLTYVIYANTWLSVLALLVALSLLSRFLLWGIAIGFGHRIFGVAHAADLLGYVVFNGGIGLVIYSFLGTVDRITFKVPRINIEMAEGGF
ncbi:MAG: hypothetical protein HYR96_15515 [Deltaproteobacteria bacterium]|nr:hypothetical protein [Deltaproteobacteria bacterium]MBI3296340.1 hypothetical protein [Deltaproteobacteria bacterium]